MTSIGYEEAQRQNFTLTHEDRKTQESHLYQHGTFPNQKIYIQKEFKLLNIQIQFHVFQKTMFFFKNLIDSFFYIRSIRGAYKHLLCPAYDHMGVEFTGDDWCQELHREPSVSNGVGRRLS